MHPEIGHIVPVEPLDSSSIKKRDILYPWRERLPSLTPKLQLVTEELSSWFTHDGWQYDQAFIDNARDQDELHKIIHLLFFNPAFIKGALPDAKALLLTPSEIS